MIAATRRAGLIGATSLLMIALSGNAAAHPISITQTSVYLTRTHATARIDVLLEDLFLFHQLAPNSEDVLERGVIERGIELHRQFLQDRFEITDARGTRYVPQSVNAVAADVPQNGVPLPELMAHQLTFELQFTFAAAPDVLTFTQRFTDEAAVLPSEMKLRVTQENAGAPFEHTLLPHNPWSLRINWDNPPLSPEASNQEREDWAARERQSLLGITSFSGVYSFLYVEDFEVRHEILIPVLTLAGEVAMPDDSSAILDIDEQTSLRQSIAQYFAAGNPLGIDDRESRPAVQRCEIFGLNLTDFAQPTEPGPIPLANARAGIILIYRTASPPKRLRLTWDRFHDGLLGVSTAVIAGDQVSRHKLGRLGNRNVLNWERPPDATDPAPLQPVVVRPIEIPETHIPWLSGTISVVCIGVGLIAIARRSIPVAAFAICLLAGSVLTWPGPFCLISVPSPNLQKLTDDEAIRIFRQVHRNTYRSFNRRDEESVYDALALSVDGRLLETIYIETRRSLAMEEQGGPSARIDDVELVSVRRNGEGSHKPSEFEVSCRWNLAGTIEHWGHIHRRRNQFDADFVVTCADGAWKLTEIELRNERHLDTKVTIRSGTPAAR
ncbi:MAG: hypothetical protein R3C19_03460 [Planctomycetaceae bacterium]